MAFLAHSGSSAHASFFAISADAALAVMLQASSFMMFPDMNTACRAASVLRTETAVDAVEVFDRASLRECEADEGLTKLVVDIKGADPGAAALLIECRGEDAQTLQVSPCLLLVALCSIREVFCVTIPFARAFCKTVEYWIMRTLMSNGSQFDWSKEWLCV